VHHAVAHLDDDLGDLRGRLTVDNDAIEVLLGGVGLLAGVQTLDDPPGKRTLGVSRSYVCWKIGR
jgi:hypothetical protein